MRDKILVLGSNSISGASFVDYALNEGYSVVGISRSPEPIEAFLPYYWNKHRDQFKFYQCDLNKDLERIIQIVKTFQPQYIINFAAQSMVAESWQHPDHWFTTNVVATSKLFESLRQLGNFEKYVHISTPEVYGNCEGLVQEHTLYNPSTPYATSRAACDMHLMNLCKTYDFPVVFTRAANVYGPGQQLYRIIPRTILSIKLGQKLPLHGGGHSVRSFIHTHDVSNGTLKAARQGNPGEIFHFSTPKTTSIRNLVQTICDTLGESFEAVVEETADRPGKDAAYLLDSAQARKELGWEDRVSLEQGLQETINWVNQYLDTLKEQPVKYIHKA